MGLQEVQSYFKKHNISNEILLLDADTSTVALAAQALGKEPGQIAKSLAFKLKDESAIMIVVMGTARIDNKKFKETFGCKASMMSYEETLERTGHAVGGVCPFGVKPDVKIYLDESLKKYDIVYPAAGTPNSAVEFTIDDLQRACGGIWIDVCKDSE